MFKLPTGARQKTELIGKVSVIERLTGSRRRVLLTGLLLPAIGAVALCGLASIWPARLDARALQDVSRVQSLGLPATSGNFVFLSRDNSIGSARAATFGLRQLAFPDGSVFWAALKERCDGPWSTGFVAVDSASNMYTVAGGAEGSFKWSPAREGPDEVRQLVARGFVLYDSNSTRAAFEQRWPFLTACERVAVLTDAPPVSSFRLRRLASEFTLARFWRIAAVLGCYLAVLLALIQASGLQRVGLWQLAAGAVLLTVGLVMGVAFLLQWVAPTLVRWGPVLLWGAVFSWAVLKRETGAAILRPASKFRVPTSRAVRMALVCSLAGYVLLFLVRLDFDGDFFNNWLPQGRFHYLLQRHDPATIIGQRSMQAASYPPGYGITLSTLMWASGMNAAASFLPGDESSFAILIYRLFVFALNAALMVLLGTHLKKIALWENGAWLGAIAVTLLLIQSTAGKHIASETLSFPMMASAILLVAAGRRSDAPALTEMGLVVGGLATLIKAEASLMLALGVLPWLAPDSLQPIVPASGRTRLKWAATLAFSMLPVLVWKLTVTVPNNSFAPVTSSRFVSSIHFLPGLIAQAARVMLDDGRLVFLGLALPAAILYRFHITRQWQSLLAPSGIVILFAGLIGVFLFSNIDPQTYLDTSYSRLMMVPTFGAILYCAEAVASARPRPLSPEAAAL